ncbi:MAG: GntR family transcriptional regulator [Victivallales bacterium]|nr:GntR family transcriptional regulator [Victivallales bacterium]
MKESVIDRVKSDLIKKIVSGEMAIGDAVLSERKLSDKYCVSYMTARKAVFELVEEGYLRKESTRGTFVANRWGGKNLSDCPVKPIIMLIMSDLISHLSHRTIGWLERIARKNNFQLMVCNSELNVTCEAMHLEQAMLMSVAGVIISPCYPPINHQALEKLLSKGTPVVQIDKYFTDLDAASVSCDNYDAAFSVVQYLHKLGHRRIAHITSNNSLRNISSINERFEGYCDALRKYGLEYREEYIQELTKTCVHTTMDDLQLQYLGYREMSNLLKLAEPPSAVFLLFDEIAVGAMRAIADYGLKVPEDISVVGINNSDISSWTDPPLTTMAQPIQELAIHAVSIIADHINGNPKPPDRIRLKAQLIVRESCKLYDREKFISGAVGK